MIPGGSDPRRGILLKTASVLGFTFMGACVKAGAAVVPISQVCFFRAFFAMLTVLAYLAWRGELPAAIWTANPWGHFWRGMLGLAAMTLTFSALAYLPLSDAIALSYAMPMFLTILAALMLGEVVRTFRWAGVLVGLVGVLVILWPRLTFLRDGGGTPDETFGAMCAIAGAFMVALGSVVVSRLVMAERATTVVFYFSAYSSAGFLLTLPFAWRTPDGWTFLVLVASGVIGGVCQLLMTASYRYADASTLAPFEYTSILFGIVLGMALFGDLPSASMLLGSAIVISAGLIILWHEHALVRRRTDTTPWPWAMIGVEKHDGS